jgi:outer membrane receptor protein involved in Fe transport
MYTGISALKETDHYQLTILGAQHQFRLADGDLWQMAFSWRRLVDDYQFNRSNPNTFFQHETRAWSFQGHGAVALADMRRIAFSWTLLEDKIVRSTSLNSGHFNQRAYVRVAAAWEEEFHYSGGSEGTMRLGLALDRTNRDGNDLSPFFRYEWRKPDHQGHWLAYLEWVQTMQVPGYTALNSAPQGAFGGNADLERERARTAELGLARHWNAWTFQSAVFHRWDRDLVDWTFDSASPSLRQANAVDLDVIGWESIISFRQDPIQLSLGYAYLDKKADYGNAAVDASYYALNYAQHRLTISAVYDVTSNIQLQADTSMRRQRENNLRQSSRDAFELNLGAVWTVDAAGNWLVSVMGENLTNSNFQHFPGAVATRRQVTGQIQWRF